MIEIFLLLFFLYGQELALKEAMNTCTLANYIIGHILNLVFVTII